MQFAKYARVRLIDDYNEHPDNVGPDRVGTFLQEGKKDYDGFVRVDFDGGRPTWVPDTAIRPLLIRSPAPDPRAARSRRAQGAQHDRPEAYRRKESDDASSDPLG